MRGISGVERPSGLAVASPMKCDGDRRGPPQIAADRSSYIAQGRQISGGYELPASATRQSLPNDSAMTSPRRARRPSPPWGAAMATEPRNRSLTWRHRQVLTVPARAPPRGRDVNALLTNGFKLETMADLIRDGLATFRVRSLRSADQRSRLLASGSRTRAGGRSKAGAPADRPARHNGNHARPLEGDPLNAAEPADIRLSDSAAPCSPPPLCRWARLLRRSAAL
jgi:hypothetical protein